MAEVEEEGTQITDLNSDVMENIVSRLDLKSAVRMSASTREWRDLSTAIPYLEFDSATFLEASLDHENHRRAAISFKKAVDHLLFTRPTNRWLQKFGIRYALDKRLSENKLHRWLYCVTRWFMITVLELGGCIFDELCGWKNFPSLHTLVISHATIPAESLTSMLNHLPLLRTLVLVKCKASNPVLVVDAPHLTAMILNGRLPLCLTAPKISISRSLLEGYMLAESGVFIDDRHPWTENEQKTIICNIIRHLEDVEVPIFSPKTLSAIAKWEAKLLELLPASVHACLGRRVQSN